MGRETESRVHGRLNIAPAFEVPMRDEYISALLQLEGTSDEPSIAMVDATILDEVRAELPSDEQFAVRQADSGRGASGYAAVIELLGTVANVGGAIATLGMGYRVVKRIHERLTKRFGGPPCVSLGAARYLAIADLVDRVGSENIQLWGSGDLSDAPPDFSFTGFDYFWVALRHEKTIYMYVVDANGQCQPMGSVPVREVGGD